MTTYAGLVLKTAFTQWLKRTDLAGGVFGVLVPCVYVLTGRPVPENVSILIAEVAVLVVVGSVLLRLLMAPYIIWKADQAKIKELQNKLDDPIRQRREAFEQGLQAARAEFAMEMRRYLDSISSSHFIHNYNAEVQQHLENYALLFLNDGHFMPIWEDFIFHLNREAQVANFSKDKNIDEFLEFQIGQNMGYHFQSRRCTARAIISYLTYVENYDETVYRELNEIERRHKDYGMIDLFDEASLNEARARRSHQDTGSKTQP